MLADTLQVLHDTENKAEKILTDANLQVCEIEKQTYQTITRIENNINNEIAMAIAELPQPEPLPAPEVKIDVPQAKMDAAVDYIIQAVHGA
ncbi:MAG: hypothetical protein KIG16_03130 [Eubacteriales bacterium]|nr:hypothetical protein [Eubacteriales bacterium]